MAHFTTKLTDNVASSCKKYLSNNGDRSLVFTCDQVEQNQTGLLQLISSKNLHAALNLTVALIRELNNKPELSQTEKLDFFQIWQTRIALLIKLAKYKEADNEARYFTDFEHPQFYRKDVEGRVFTIVPFTFRVLLAELSSYCKRGDEALDKLVVLEEKLGQLKTIGVDISENLACLNESRDRILRQNGRSHLCSSMSFVNKLEAGIEVNIEDLTNPIERGLVHMMNSRYIEAYDEFLKGLGDENYDQGLVVNNTALALQKLKKMSLFA